jgi:two-component system response regulator AtoC
MMSAYGDSDTAVDCLSRGAFDYVAKPFRSREIIASVERVVDRDRLEVENKRLRAKVERSDRLGRFVGRSEAALAVMALVRRAAGYPSTVLLTGESGTGKELLARALHDQSPRSAGPFVPINCAAIPDTLLESELFGHERGAFTGAERARPGLFERADGGTLLLDEIGDMPVALQTRLLRVLEDGRVRRVGARDAKEVDVRVVAATAQDLDEAVRSGRFRDDLYYRLNVVRVRVPPLRERRSDIPLLVATLVERASKRLGREVFSVSDRVLDLLTGHDWPGNVRELENVLERAVIVVPPEGRRVELEHISLDGRPGPVSAAPVPSAATPGVVQLGLDDGEEPLSIKLHSARLERHLIELALRRTDGHRGRAAALLEISSKALAYKIRDYGIQP